MIYICMIKWMIENKLWCINFKMIYIIEINIFLVVKILNVWMWGVFIIYFCDDDVKGMCWMDFC